MTKLTPEQLYQIIREELKSFLEANPYHKEDGTWGSKNTSSSYSIGIDKVNKLGLKDTKPGKYQVTKTGKLRPKYGLADCGRTDVKDSSPIPIKKRCRDFPSGYEDEVDEAVDLNTGMPQSKHQRAKSKSRRGRIKDIYGDGAAELDSLARGITESGIISGDREVQFEENERCSHECYQMAWKRFLLTLNQIELARSGKLGGE